jgi:hypothetical protein
MAVSSTWPAGTVTTEEKRGWILAGEALQRGLLTMCQLVAVKS